MTYGDGRERRIVKANMRVYVTANVRVYGDAKKRPVGGPLFDALDGVSGNIFRFEKPTPLTIHQRYRLKLTFRDCRSTLY